MKTEAEIKEEIGIWKTAKGTGMYTEEIRQGMVKALEWVLE